MSPIKNYQFLLYRHFNNTIKELGTSFQSPAFNQKPVRNVCHYNTLVFDQISFSEYLGFRRNKCKYNFHYPAMLTMTSQILKSADFTTTQKS